MQVGPQIETDGSSGSPRRRLTGWLPAHASRGNGRAHRLFHPLCGAAPDTLLQLLLKGGVQPARAHVVAIALAMTVLRLPFTLGEAATAHAMLRLRTHRHGTLPAPVFIVGHWRSGTTHLTNLLSNSPEFGILSPMSVGLPAEALGLGRLARPFIEQFFPRTRLIDTMPLRPDLPQEDELAMANLSTLSCTHGLYFPDRLLAEFDRGVFLQDVGAAELASWMRRLVHYVGKMTLAAGGRPLLIRNPANSARIPLLRSIWPDARFIHIHREPADVCASSTRMFATLIRELSLGKTDAADTHARDLVARLYPRLMTALATDLGTIPAGHVTEIRYETFRQHPLEELERVHAKLGLALRNTTRQAFANTLAAAPPHVPSRAPMGSPGLDWLPAHRAIFERWNYAVPSG